MGRVSVKEVFLMHRFYACNEDNKHTAACLSAEDAHHALHVLRLKKDDEIEIILNGCRYLARLDPDSNTDCAVPVKLISELPSTETGLKITLYQGLPKADKMDWIVQKATELGVIRIVPVIMNRCISRPDAKDMLRKTERWQKIAREAGKQSGRCLIPEVTVPVRLKDILPHLCAHGGCVVPWEEAHSLGPAAYSAGNPSLSSLGIIIGPEGGIEEEEIALLKEHACVPVTLGPRILRTETAGLAACAAFLALYGEME